MKFAYDRTNETVMQRQQRQDQQREQQAAHQFDGHIPAAQVPGILGVVTVQSNVGTASAQPNVGRLTVVPGSAVVREPPSGRAQLGGVSLKAKRPSAKAPGSFDVVGGQQLQRDPQLDAKMKQARAQLG